MKTIIAVGGKEDATYNVTKLNLWFCSLSSYSAESKILYRCSLLATHNGVHCNV